MFLEKKLFSGILKNTPLISIDLIIENEEGQFLLGKRVNEPAKDFWFVPGGRIYKDETLDNAFNRILEEEIGLDITREQAVFYGLYEHFYENNVFNTKFGTHYIVLAHKTKVSKMPNVNSQHSAYQWFAKDELLNKIDVHKYTKDYFR